MIVKPENRRFKSIENYVSSYLIEKGFEVIDRENIKLLLKEQKLTLEGVLKGNESIEPGILGVDAIMLVEIYYFNPKKKHDDIYFVSEPSKKEILIPVYKKDDKGNINVLYRKEEKYITKTKRIKKTRRYIEAGVTAKLIDVETGKIIWSMNTENSSLNFTDLTSSISNEIAEKFYKDYKKVI